MTTAIKEVAPKTYYHRIPGSTYISHDNVVHYFLGGQFTTTDPIIQADLDKQIANGVNMIRTNKLAVIDPAALKLKQEVDARAIAAAKLAAAEAAKHQ